MSMILDTLQKFNAQLQRMIFMFAVGIFACVPALVSAETPQNPKFPWRSHASQISNQNYAADMPVQKYHEQSRSPLPTAIEDPKINHYPDPFASQNQPAAQRSEAPWVQLQSEMQTTKAKKPSPFSTKPLEFVVMEINVRDFLQELTRENGNFSLSMSRDVDGLIKNARLNGTVEDILQKLAREFNFEWMVDGPELYIASRNKNDYKIIKDKRLTDDLFQEALSDIYAPNLSYMVKNNRLNNSVDLRGPKDFVKRFEQRFESTEANQIRMIRAGKVYQE